MCEKPAKNASFSRFYTFISNFGTMKKMNLLLLLLASLAFFHSGCDNPADEETAPFVLDVKALINDEPLVLGDTYQNGLDYHFNLTVLRFYLSHLTLVKPDGSEVEVKDVELLDLENHHAVYQAQGEQISGTVPAGTYTALRFAIGVDSTLNHDDPAQYPSTHPLSIYYGMHWDWNPGYIFLKLEGNADTVANGGGTLDRAFIYHVGADALYREVRFEDDFTVAPDENFEYKVKLDANRLFYNETDTLDMEKNFTHTGGDFTVAENVLNLFAAAFFKR